MWKCCSVTIWKLIAIDAEKGAERLVAEYGDRLMTSAFFLTQNEADAEDLVFRTFSRVIERISQYSGRSQFYTWMYSIMMNFRKMDLRRKAANSLDFTDEPINEEDSRPDPAEQVALGATEASVRSAIASLPEALRSVVVLVYFDDMDVREAASALGIAVGTVKSRLFHARKRLAEILSRTVFDDGASK